MKLLTLNCHSWQEDDQFAKITILAETIQEKSYDVIALQEVSQSIKSEIIDGQVKEDNFARVLLEELKKLGNTDYQFVWDFSHIGFDIYEEGLALLTKHPIEKTTSFFISQSENTEYWKTRKIVGANIRMEDDTFSFYSCHLGWWGDEEEPFKQQIDALCDKANGNKKYFLMGDFNNDAHIKGEGYDYLLSKDLYDSYTLSKEKDSGITVAGKIAGWDKNKRDLRIDYIFSNFPVNVQNSSVIFNGENKPVISDHYGVEITI
ncbi:endonuclease/exonuclease/phosphatase family protein [Metabacillus halosaccharovorans]|uniref:endonuclease/exonuclease/phosphatase family protein n=1 Tax=Metabacillus halosaccharovorans TaxID=930124 RepID=UPI001C1FF77F|nr:endonuclease/exonuclease/phosphatase family protein [Metabacillus halosaccharovorans]MBU7592928.1 endonuclease/exonuclease/phosphatase family protein [Metabacillus halosaccharovorans]